MSKSIDRNYNVSTTDPMYMISCEECGIIADFGWDVEVVRHTAEQLGFIAVHTEADGTLNFCQPCSSKREFPNA